MQSIQSEKLIKETLKKKNWKMKYKILKLLLDA